MKILSIDVGIKNLAYCLFDNNNNTHVAQFKISKWNTIDLSQESINLHDSLLCKEICKNKLCCNKSAKYSKNSIYYCLKHAKKEPFHIPKLEMKSAFINKQKIQQLRDLATKYNIVYNDTLKRSELILLINTYISTHCFELIQNTNINASKLDLITIGRNIQLKFDEIFSQDISTITNVIIENQISPIANRMKTIQGMIAQYFIMKNKSINIEFISATNKLKKIDGIMSVDPTVTVDPTVAVDPIITVKPEVDININNNLSEKTKYKNRKNKGIQICLDLITFTSTYILTDQDWKLFFVKHSKKDDLSDAFLQGVWYITTKCNKM